MHDDITGNHPDHLAAHAFPAEAAREVHETAAFRIGGQAIADGVPDPVSKRCIGLQGFHMGFRETAADEKTLDLGQVPVLQGIDRHQLRARLFQRLQIIRVIETEGRVTGNADSHPFS